MIRTIFFDLDGVIIDSEPVHAKAKKTVLDYYGIKYPSTVFDDFKGQPDDAFFKHISEELDILKRPFDLMVARKKEVFPSILNEIKIIDGAIPFIEKVKAKGIHTALVSSTSEFTLGFVNDMFHFTHLFDLIVTETDTPNHKPHPDPYLYALQTMKVPTDESFVIEDSPNGIRSAKLAGCTVYALTTSFTRDKLGEADEICNSFHDLSVKANIF